MKHMNDKQKYIAKFRGIEIPVSTHPSADMNLVLINLDMHGKQYYRKMKEYGIKFLIPELNEFFDKYFTPDDYQTEP